MKWQTVRKRSKVQKNQEGHPLLFFFGFICLAKTWKIEKETILSTVNPHSKRLLKIDISVKIVYLRRSETFFLQKSAN